MDLHQDTSTWCFDRSRQSEHFIVFWAKEYGTVNPAECADQAYRVNIDSLLSQAEHFCDVNVNKLKFLTPGSSKNPWDEKTDNDEQWPYKVRFEGTTLVN
jgi:hypothetical protein